MIKALRDLVISRSGFAVGYRRSNVLISNVFNLLIAGNERATEIGSLGVTEELHDTKLTDILHKGRSPITEWMPSAGPTYGAKMDIRTVLQEQPQHISAMFWATTMPRKHISNYAAHLAEKFIPETAKGGSVGWATRAVGAAALGYARRSATFTLTPGLTDPMIIPSECHPWSIAVAKALFELDRPSLSPLVIPELKQFQGADARRSPTGPVGSLEDQTQYLGSIPAAYSLCGPLLAILLHEGWMRAAAVECERRRADWAPTNAQFLEALDYCKANIPLHRMVATIASMARPGILDSSHGELPLAWLITERALESIMGDFSLKAAAALRNLTHLSWGDCATPSDDTIYTTIPALARRVATMGKVGQQMANSTAALGWRGGVDLSIARLSQVQPEFVLCDGQAYSSSPAPVVGGVVPSLSLGNFKGTGLEPEYMDTSFDVANNTHSVLVVDGYQSPTSLVGVYTRHTIMAGMWMGEPDAEYVSPEALKHDPTAVQVRAYYQARSSSYVRDRYGAPVVVEDGSAVHIPWDYIPAGDDVTTVQKQLLDAHKADVLPVAQCAMFTFLGPKVSHRFYHRVPVESAWANVGAGADTGLAFYDHDGVLRYSLRLAKRVMFEGHTVDVNTSTALLESIVNLAQVPGTKALDVLGDQAEP